MERGHVCGTQRLGTCTQQQNQPEGRVNGRGYFTCRHTGRNIPFSRALESPLHGRKVEGKSFPGRKGERWDYRTEALVFPSDCSLILPVYTGSLACAHTCTQQHSAGSERTSGASPGTFLPTSFWGLMGKKAGEQSEQWCLPCTCGQSGLCPRVAMCACSSSHQGWAKRESHPGWY